MAAREETVAPRGGSGVVVPQALEAEDYVVAAVLVAAVGGVARADGVVAQARQAGLSGGFFYRASRRVLWETAAGLVDRGETQEIPVVLDELERIGLLEEAGGRAAAFGLAVPPGHVGGVAGWAARVVAKHRQRQLAALGDRLVQAAVAGADTGKIGEGLREALQLVEGAGQSGVEVALPLNQFLALQLDPAEPLLGDHGENLVPRAAWCYWPASPRWAKQPHTARAELVFDTPRKRPGRCPRAGCLTDPGPGWAPGGLAVASCPAASAPPPGPQCSGLWTGGVAVTAL